MCAWVKKKIVNSTYSVPELKNIMAKRFYKKKKDYLKNQLKIVFQGVERFK
jgi:hypothetical protein